MPVHERGEPIRRAVLDDHRRDDRVVGVDRNKARRPLTIALLARVGAFAETFRRMVLAQIKISAINATFTAIYLLAVLPVVHVKMPLVQDPGAGDLHRRAADGGSAT